MLIVKWNKWQIVLCPHPTNPPKIGINKNQKCPITLCKWSRLDKITVSCHKVCSFRLKNIIIFYKNLQSTNRKRRTITGSCLGSYLKSPSCINPSQTSFLFPVPPAALRFSLAGVLSHFFSLPQHNQHRRGVSVHRMPARFSDCHFYLLLAAVDLTTSSPVLSPLYFFLSLILPHILTNFYALSPK